MEIKGDAKRGLRLVAEGFDNNEALITDLHKTLALRHAFLGHAMLEIEVDDLALTSDLLASIAQTFEPYPNLMLGGVVRGNHRPDPIPLTRRLEPALVIRHTLRSGQHQFHAGDLIVVGDVNPGATVAAAGDILVFGRLRGTAHAGQPHDVSKAVYALTFIPQQVRIGSLLAIGEGAGKDPEFAHVEDGHVLVEAWTDVRLPESVVSDDNKHRGSRAAHPSSS